MGQYRQWLFYREIDQQLNAQIQAFEADLATLQTEIKVLAQDTSYSENSILQTLLGVSPAETTSSTSDILPQKTELAETNAPIATVSPALFAWSRLPNFDTQDIQDPIMNAATQNVIPPPSLPEDDLLPHNIGTIEDAHGQTDPQLKVPWWLRNTRNATDQDPQKTSPIDQQSRRTNHLVERWFERWGEAPENAEKSQEGPNASGR